MRSAVYYPHTQIRDESFLKNALLLWDRVEFVSPSKAFHFDEAESVQMREALDILCVAHVPSSNEKDQVHVRVVELLKKGLPDWLIAKAVPYSISSGRRIKEFSNGYGMYPEKLDHKTWSLLEAAGIVRLMGSDYDYYTRPMVGFLLMSLLADACAGTQKEKITDRVDAYDFLWGLVAAEGTNEISTSATPLQKKNHALERLVGISIKTIDTDEIPLSNILAMRRREESSGGQDYRAFRKRYGEKLKDCAANLVTKAKTEGDWLEIEREFQQDMSDDLASLRHELGVAKKELLFSKETLTMVAAGGALLLEPMSATLALAAKMFAGGALVKDVSSFSGNYKKALEKHPMSWLYLSQKPSLRSVPFGNLGKS